MASPLVPQEIFLLERYSSVDYFAEMRDAWSAMVKHAEHCLDVFVHALPSDYRSRPLFDQPDIVWGERVLPNFRDTLSGLDEAFIRLTHGDKGALSYANGVSNDFAGFSRDHSSEWMDEPQVAKEIPDAGDAFWRLLGQATERASNVNPTWGGYWATGDLTTRFDPLYRSPLNPPAQWPTYRLNPKVRVASGQPAPRTGIYLPDANDSVAALLIEGKPAVQASIGYDPMTTQNVSLADTTWTLVERTADSGGGTPGDADPVKAGVRLRCLAGQPCPREGFWFTPARANSRRNFGSSELMPEVGGDYGVTIWQWDEQQ
jgi:hypothetical protein